MSLMDKITGVLTAVGIFIGIPALLIYAGYRRVSLGEMDHRCDPAAGRLRARLGVVSIHLQGRAAARN